MSQDKPNDQKQKPTQAAGLRFFSAPQTNIFADDPKLGKRRSTSVKRKKRKKKEPKMRYAGYVRVSSEEQVDNFSIRAQRRAIESWVEAKDGVLVKVYVDEGESGRTADRPAFQRMRRDARKGKFDALVVHKFDRFARNRTDALAIKSLLRYDYEIKVFSVTEPSEDSDGPMGALIEGIMESVADWYSRNLGTEVAKGKKERGNQGLHNNRAPYGYKKNDEGVLVPEEDEVSGLRLAFEKYATGKFSDTQVAHLLNRKGYRSKTGRPFSKDTVRDMLQNQTYLGMVKYQKYERNGDGSRSYDAPVQLFEGQHEAVIDEDLFERCQQARAKRRSHRQATKRYHPYLLRNLIYCYRCCANPPEGKTFRNYGKMRPQSQAKGQHRYYRCRARELGYECEQAGVNVENIDEQAVSILMQLKPPENWRKGITKAMSEILGEKNLEERLVEIHEAIERMDFRWDHGFIVDERDYIDKRLKLQHELEQLTPVPDDDLERAADLLENFTEHWEAREGDTEAQHELVKLIVERVYVNDERIVAMTLRSNYHIVLGHNVNGPTQAEVDPFLYTDGSDGHRSLSGRISLVLVGWLLDQEDTSTVLAA